MYYTEKYHIVSVFFITLVLNFPITYCRNLAFIVHQDFRDYFYSTYNANIGTSQSSISNLNRFTKVELCQSDIFTFVDTGLFTTLQSTDPAKAVADFSPPISNNVYETELEHREVLNMVEQVEVPVVIDTQENTVLLNALPCHIDEYFSFFFGNGYISNTYFALEKVAEEETNNYYLGGLLEEAPLIDSYQTQSDLENTFIQKHHSVVKNKEKPSLCYLGEFVRIRLCSVAYVAWIESEEGAALSRGRMEKSNFMKNHKNACEKNERISFTHSSSSTSSGKKEKISLDLLACTINHQQEFHLAIDAAERYAIWLIRAQVKPNNKGIKYILKLHLSNVATLKSVTNDELMGKWVEKTKGKGIRTLLRTDKNSN